MISISLSFVDGEKYYVTFVKGSVTLKKTGKPIKVGDILQSTDALIFKEQTAKLSCISPGKGRFEINAQKTKPSSNGELLAVLKNNLVPSTSTYHLSSRSLMFDGYDPKTYFQSTETDNRILLLLDEVLPISPTYKIDENNFFFIQYVTSGKTITKKIDQSDKGLVFTTKLFTEGIPQKVMLCYQAQIAGKPKSSSVVEFTPIIANKADLKNEIKVLTTNLGLNKKLIAAAVTAHIFDNYGKLSQDQIDKLML
ncbi:hypothetical protein GM921_02680 [Pedobacter sp. LMG 31464]|uniref:Uncharacterized protein n=1 Tax=Pedobacter planticolens TaxID=2679964 RepID=A0A923DXP9_9SPHI|nr:hypothetical protein [Pedobacter planticolens]MBB2144378.1 hypothetical protein [Pedobacter planticolens]